MANVANTLLFALMGQRQQQQAAEQARFDQRREEGGRAAVGTARAADEAMAADLARQEAVQKTRETRESDAGYYSTLLGRSPEQISDWRSETPLGETGDLGGLKAASELDSSRKKNEFALALEDLIRKRQEAVQGLKNTGRSFRPPPYNPAMQIAEMKMMMDNLGQEQDALELQYKSAEATVKNIQDALSSPNYIPPATRLNLKEQLGQAMDSLTNAKQELSNALNYRGLVGEVYSKRRGLPTPPPKPTPAVGATEPAGTAVTPPPTKAPTGGISVDKVRALRGG